MAGSLNRATLIGNLGRDPEIRSLQSGGRVASLSVATTEKWTDKHTGEKRERTEWHRVVVFSDGLVGVVEKYLAKGDKVYVEGQLQTRKWTDQDGIERYTTEIVLQPYNGQLVLLGSPGRDGQGQGQGYGYGPPPQQGYGRQQQSYRGPQDNRYPPQGGGYRGPAGGGHPNDDLDDEIPF